MVSQNLFPSGTGTLEVLVEPDTRPGSKMLTASHNPKGPPITVDATIKGLAIYLDNFSIIRLAKYKPTRRKRLVEVLQAGKAELAFSMANAVELTGAQGDSLEMAISFLNEIGPRWFPLELNPVKVVRREQRGTSRSEAFLSKDFMEAYFKDRLTEYLPGSGKIVNLSGDFFQLGEVLEWTRSQRAANLDYLERLDNSLADQVRLSRNETDRNPAWLDQNYPAVPFDPLKPATFALAHTMRTLVTHAKGHPIKKGDGIDLCHAVIGSAFASVATLDKHWKKRIESLPKPNGLACIYYQPELDQLVADIESF